jgi:protein NrfC
MKENKRDKSKRYSRRDFVVGGGVAIAGGALGVATAAKPAAASAPAKADYPLSTGYIVYDSRLCAGFQISRSVLTRYPYDIQIAVCRQCPTPLCVDNCPTGACHVSTENGNVRMTDPDKCIGCQTCLKSCPYAPHRTIWIPAANKATKCDLCADSPYFSKKGGPSGEQACVTTCPMKALKLVTQLPSQTDIAGYDVDLAPPPPPPGKSGPPGAKPKNAPPKKP